MHMFSAKAALLTFLALVGGGGAGFAASQVSSQFAPASQGQAMEEGGKAKPAEAGSQTPGTPRARPAAPGKAAVPEAAPVPPSNSEASAQDVQPEAAPAPKPDMDRLPPPKPERADDVFARARPDVREGKPDRPVACTFDGAVMKRAAQPLPDVPACQIPVPVALSAVGDEGEIALTPSATLDCALAASYASWMSEVVAPAALAHLGSRVESVQVAASFHCRRRNNLPNGKLSEHATGNAIDISAFRLADGRQVSVEEGWKGDGAEKAFLLVVRKAACDRFLTVLSPEGDAYHQDHLHLDQGCHGKTCTYRICQ
ncbi:extensin family protein [Breoghania sp.]|uniref:extensin-like domain-containing protein n=1 Tax=Breoghania sp. TaxID=2065378 RepID=UPI002AAB1288|nr:extensin family protein [Breoghania sp.]